MTSNVTAGTSASPKPSPKASPLPLDPDALHILRTSVARLTQFIDDFIAWLHQDIVTLSPHVAASMAEEGWSFCDRMARAMLWVAMTDGSPNVVADVLRQVGADNWREGFPDTEYVSVAHALIRTIRGIADTEWSTSLGSAWISCFQWTRPHMVAGARQAAAEAAPESEAESEAESKAEAEAAKAAGSAPQPQPRGERPESYGQADVDPAPTNDLLDDDEDDPGYGQIMVSMTLNPRRERPHS